MEFDFANMYEHGRVAAPSERYDALRMAGPVFWSDTLNGWVVTRYAENKAILVRLRDFHNGDSPQRAAFGYDAMLFHDRGVHDRLRAVWARDLLPNAVAGHAALLAQLARERLGPMRDKLQDGETVDLVPIFQDYTTDAITSLMNVPAERRADFQRWNRAMSDTAQLLLSEDDPRFAQRVKAKQEVYAYLDSEIDDRRSRLAQGEGPADLVALMVAAEGAEGITRQVVADNLLNLFLGALDTTVRWMGNIVVLLDQHPAARAEIAADPRLMPQAFEEILRFRSVVQVTTRHVRAESVELGGATLNAGDMVYVMPGIANWDPDVFPKPDLFDIHRASDPQKTHLGFGFGVHQCLGMHIARGEVLAFFRDLFADIQRLEIVGVDYGPSWSLWGPYSLRVRCGNGGLAT